MANLIEIVFCVLEIIVVFIYFNGIFDRKEWMGESFYLYFLAAVVINVLRTRLYLSFAVNVTVTAILWLLIVLLCYDGAIARKLFFTAVNMISVVISEIVTALLLSEFLKIEYDDGFTTRYIGCVFSLMLLFAFNIYTIYVAKKKYRILPIKYNVLMILCPILSVFLLMVLDSYIAQSQNRYHIMSFIAVLGLGYINIMVFDFFDYYEKGLKTQTLDVILKANEENYTLLEENEKELHILRHDILKYMAEIEAMLSSRNNEAAEQYVKELNDIVLKHTSVSRTGCLILDTILNVECKKAVSLGIKYDLKLNISEKINVPSLDLSQILYNALDNAIEACEKTAEKYILLSISSYEKTLKIVIENTSPYVEIRENQIKTTKVDKIRHGYGIASMRNAVIKNEGLISFDYKNGIFLCRIVLKNDIG